MSPFLCDGETLQMKPCEGGDFRVGDVVVYRAGSQNLVHRIVQISNRRGAAVCRLKGDANFRCDPPIAKERIIAKALKPERHPVLTARLSFWEARLFEWGGGFRKAAQLLRLLRFRWVQRQSPSLA